MTNHSERLEMFLQCHPDTEVLEVMLLDLVGGWRGKWVGREKMDSVAAGEMKLPHSTLAFDSWGRDLETWVFETGDCDAICIPDLSTLVPVPWADRPTAQMMVSLQEIDGTDSRIDPRNILKHQIDRLANIGYSPVVACEMEFFLLSLDQDSLGRPIHTQTDRVGGRMAAGQTYGLEIMGDMSTFVHALRDAAKVQGLPLDALIKESAPSQYEVNLQYSSNAIVAADQAVMLQRLIRGVAQSQDLLATFMAKPFGNIAGSGFHIHCSLLDEDGNNVFSDDSPLGSSLLRKAVGGCLDSLKDCMLLFAPNLNSYRRFQTKSHAPLSPSWGYENRTAAIRIPASDTGATRLEHRVSGADVNPHLAVSGFLAAIYRGIQEEIDPPDPIVGNAYDHLDNSLPCYWPDALHFFEKSAVIRESFGEQFQKIFSLVKRQEMAEFDCQVTPLEYDTSL